MAGLSQQSAPLLFCIFLLLFSSILSDILCFLFLIHKRYYFFLSIYLLYIYKAIIREVKLPLNTKYKVRTRIWKGHILLTRSVMCITVVKPTSLWKLEQVIRFKCRVIVIKLVKCGYENLYLINILGIPENMTNSDTTGPERIHVTWSRWRPWQRL